MSQRNAMRAYGLSSTDGVGLYIHHYNSHTNIMSGKKVTFKSPQSGRGYWIDPEIGKVLGTVCCLQRLKFNYYT